MNPDTINRYLYIEKTPSFLLKGIYIYGIAAWLLVIYAYSRFIFIDPIYSLFILPFIIFFTFYFLISYGINFFYKHLDVRTHKNKIEAFWKYQLFPPAVDVFLPICGEDTDVVRNTFTAVRAMKYKNKKVYVLDDKGLDEHKQLSKIFGFTYLSRENKGHMKKAGNIKHGFQQSNGEFIVIFDADFAPHKDFINELIPYMEDTKVGIIQTPQYFQSNNEVYKNSKLEYGAAVVQEDFYRFIQVARGNLGAPICCGSNAVYRRAALEDIGGTVQIEHSEDMYTGFNLMKKGWKVKYLPIILAIGLCPENMHAYFHQQHRWCSGSMSLMMDKDFWLSNLTYGQKLSYISGFMYYLSYPITFLISFNAFVLLFLFARYMNFHDSLLFLPYMLFSFLILPAFRIAKPRPGNIIARTACAYSYTHAVVTAFLHSTVGWEPTNAKKVKISKQYRQVILFAKVYLLVYVLLCGALIGRGLFQIFNINYSFVLFLIIYNFFSITLVLYQMHTVFEKEKVAEAKKSEVEKVLSTSFSFDTL